MSRSAEAAVPVPLPIGITVWQYQNYAVRLDVRRSGWTVVTSQTPATEKWLMGNYSAPVLRIRTELTGSLMRALKEEGRRTE
jgi:hypothetical protein